MKKEAILIAGGGTGGHVFPAVAVAEAMQRMADVDVVFCGTPRGIEARVVPARGWTLELFDVEPIVGGGPVRAIRGAFVAARATARAVAFVRRLRPCVVLSVGGYASGPVTLAAALLGIPVAILEPNSVVGLANRLMAPFAKRAYVAWEGAAGRFPRRARRLFGVPVRPGFAPRPYAARGSARVLVLGGSQGAASLNERVPAAVARLRGLPGLEVTHQAGQGRDDEVRQAYERAGVETATVTPFLDDVARAIGEADLVLARAGAGTIAEITAVGRAAVLVPFPHAAGDHQARNAEALAAAGAAVCVRQEVADAQRLAIELNRLLTDDGARVAMADASRGFGKADAAVRVAADLLALGGVSANVDVRRSSGGGANGASHGRVHPQEVR